MRYGFKPKINCLSTHKPLQNTAASQNAVLTALFRRGKFWNDCRNKFIPIHYVHWLFLFGIHILKKETSGKKKNHFWDFFHLPYSEMGITRGFFVSFCVRYVQSTFAIFLSSLQINALFRTSADTDECLD